MPPKSANKRYEYIVDEQDRIVRLCDNWLYFAECNGGGETCHPNMVMNKPIWDFIEGGEATHLYQVMLKRIRASNRGLKFSFRCDSPDKRRFLELAIEPLNTFLRFTTYIMREESRDPVVILDASISRSQDCVKMCSVCKKIKVDADSWAEVESAITNLKLFERPQMPAISHGVCGDCFKVMMAEIEKLQL